MSVHMAKKSRFKRGQLLQNLEDNIIYIFIKHKSNKLHLVKLDEYGNPIELVLLDSNCVGPVKIIPETFKSIEI